MSNLKEKIRNAFLNGELETLSVNPNGRVEWKTLQACHRVETPKSLKVLSIETEHGVMGITEDHKVFTNPTSKKPAIQLKGHDSVLSLQGTVVITSVQEKDYEPYMFDITVQDNHNFVVKQTNIVVSNCPDRNYRFNPPEGEGEVGCYNQVFGYIWTDEEFYEYLEMALWKWNLHPPSTEHLRSIDMLCSQNPSWKAALLWGSLVTAAQALVYNWIVNEFDYSIGGISLNIEKSSKYEGMKSNAEEQWDKLVEAKSRTTKYMRGLAQPRFGRGVRSAFGPHVGSGILSPRSFI